MGDEFTCYAETSSPAGMRHQSPAWQVLLSWDGPVTAVDERGRVTSGAGVLVPPRLRIADRNAGGITVLWIDPHGLVVPREPRIHALERTQVRRLLAATDGDLDPARVRGTVRRVLGGPVRLDPRLRRVLDVLDEDVPIEALADVAGISPRRLRQLAAPAFGGSLTMLRRWHRLREAGLRLPFTAAAEVAAQTGFSDQAHLIRTSVALCGRTPGSSAARRA
ncbi:AraC family transcriptional regulator [Nocardia sp. NPDC051030]|uniref:AraC family transcriptional regulator n=1 Tax=Nocardia sp. NPDC051030 TaxID=3155162 RepID=UPI0034157C06